MTNIFHEIAYSTHELVRVPSEANKSISECSRFDRSNRNIFEIIICIKSHLYEMVYRCVHYKSNTVFDGLSKYRPQNANYM